MLTSVHTNPNAIAVMGFSAGGHAAGSLGVSWHRGELWQEMGLTPEMVRPNAMVLCYPVITGGEYAHRDSFVALTGSANVRDHLAYSLDTQVTPHCPPTFLWHTFTDQAVPVQNSLMMASALRDAGVSAELRIYPFGRHGLSLANDQVCLGDDLAAVDPDIRTWCALAAQFLKKDVCRGVISVFILTPVRYTPALLVEISEFGLNSKIKKFSCSFICRKGYSLPAGENSFLSIVCAGAPCTGFFDV